MYLVFNNIFDRYLFISLQQLLMKMLRSQGKVSWLKNYNKCVIHLFIWFVVQADPNDPNSPKHKNMMTWSKHFPMDIFILSKTFLFILFHKFCFQISSPAIEPLTDGDCVGNVWCVASGRWGQTGWTQKLEHSAPPIPAGSYED